MVMLCLGQAVIHPPAICRPKGRPLLQRAHPSSCHPPKIASAQPSVEFRNRSPGPKGNLYTESAVIRCFVSKSAAPAFCRGLNELISTPVDASAVVPTEVQLVQVRSASDPMSNAREKV